MKRKAHRTKKKKWTNYYLQNLKPHWQQQEIEQILCKIETSETGKGKEGIRW